MAKTREELDDILNCALDELELEESEERESVKIARSVNGTNQPLTSCELPFNNGHKASSDSSSDEGISNESHKEEDEDTEALANAMKEFLQDPNMVESLQSAACQMGDYLDGAQLIQETARLAESGHVGRKGETDVDKCVARTLACMSKEVEGVKGEHVSTAQNAGEDVMEAMMTEFEKLGQKDDFNEIFDDIMEQLLSRDLMYEPLKELYKAYPEWLALNKEKISLDDYERYGKQYQTLQHILAVYDTEPDNFPRLFELMKDLQGNGNLPSDIVENLAPGLQVNADGIPMIPNLGETMFPSKTGVGPQCPQS
eukprot:322064_1